MRLWHYELIPYLPNKQLLAQWRELNSIFKKQDKHILINYIYEYSKEDLLSYSILVLLEMKNRGFKVNINKGSNYDNFYNKVREECEWLPHNIEHPFENHHTDRYLIQCFYNLQEKYDRGQKDFDYNTYWKLERFIQGYLYKEKKDKEN